jgi:hypothetical protein
MSGFKSDYPFQNGDYVMHKHGDTQAFGKIIEINESKSQTIYYITKIFGEETTVQNFGEQDMRHLSGEELYTIQKYKEAGRYVDRLEQQIIDYQHYPKIHADYNVEVLNEFRVCEDSYNHIIVDPVDEELPWTLVANRRK